MSQTTSQLLQKEINRRISKGVVHSTLKGMEQRLAKIGYRLDRSMDCKCLCCCSDGRHYPVITIGIIEIDTGQSAFNIGSRRDLNFKKLQDLRFRDEEYLVVIQDHILSL